MSSERVSVVKINVEDSQWKSFAAAFEKFKNSSAAQTESTKEAVEAQTKLNAEKRKGADIEKTVEKGAKTERIEKAKSDKASSEDLKKKVAATDKEYQTRKKQRAEDIQHLRDTVKWTADVARNVASTAFSAAKWLAFSAVASGFGLGGLAASASNARRASQHLGINTGELRAANVNFGKYIDPESALGNFANAKDSKSQQYLFNQIGVSTQGKNAGDLLAESLPKLVATFKQIGGNKDTYEGRGLSQLLSFEDVRALNKLTAEELTTTIDAYKKDREKLNVDDDTGRAWQEFIVSMKRAGEGIEVSLIKSLKTLTPYLEDFAKGIGEAIEKFAANGGMQVWIAKVGDAMKQLGTYLASNEFQEDVGTFIAAIHTMAGWIAKLLPSTYKDRTRYVFTGAGDKAIKAGGGMTRPDVFGDAPAQSSSGGRSGGSDVLNHNVGNLRVPGSASKFQSFNSDDDGVRAIANQLRLYENRDGLTTLRGIISKYSPSNENNTEALIANASKRTGFGADEKLDPASMDQLVKLVVAITKQEHSTSNYTADGVKVIIQNQTGGSAQATVAAMN